MSVKRFVSRARSNDGDRIRIRAMWEPEPWASRRRGDQIWFGALAALVAVVVVVGRTVL